MSDVQHTPGPWVANPSRYSSVGFVIDGLDARIAVLSAGDGGGGSHTKLPDVQSANARLIAAAPDLLAALEAIWGAGTGFVAATATDNGREEWGAKFAAAVEQAAAAIAKARGEDDR